MKGGGCSGPEVDPPKFSIGKLIQKSDSVMSDMKTNSKNSEAGWVPKNPCLLGEKPICNLKECLEWFAPRSFIRLLIHFFIYWTVVGKNK